MPLWTARKIRQLAMSAFYQKIPNNQVSFAIRSPQALFEGAKSLVEAEMASCKSVIK